jgi:hypothetical protein
MEGTKLLPVAYFQEPPPHFQVYLGLTQAVEVFFYGACKKSKGFISHKTTL